jgi:tetratricopeptide (TPR) repeat protein
MVHRMSLLLTLCLAIAAAAEGCGPPQRQPKASPTRHTERVQEAPVAQPRQPDTQPRQPDAQSAQPNVVPPPVAQPSSKQPSGRVPLYTDLGSLHHSITTSEPLAQQYFDQGLRLVYAFNHEEAVRSFEEAASLDPSAAMAYWGIALALGPNINAPMDKHQERRASEAIQKSRAQAQHVTPREQEFIEALAVRYSVGPDVTRRVLDQHYADAMQRLSQHYPDDPDAAVLYAEALMDLRPWDLWQPDGQPQPGTLDIVAVLEWVLKRKPDHPGACHYYIHTVEASPHPERAVPCADQLPRLMPGAGHLVHMPAHIYMRLGLYDKVAERNEHAVATDQRYLAEKKVEGLYPTHYYPHNIHFLWAALLMQGRSAEAFRTARDLVQAVPAKSVRDEPALEVFTAAPLLTLVRFAKWEDILREAPPGAELRYTTAIWHYARGMARVANRQLKEAESDQQAVAKLADAMPVEREAGNSSAKALVRIAALALAGQIAAQRGQHETAIQHLQAAVTSEDRLKYNEPPDWPYSVRQSLGAVLLEAGRVAEAEAVFREDLARHPENGWSLYGLTQALRKKSGMLEAGLMEARFKQAWAQADVANPLRLEAFKTGQAS